MRPSRGPERDRELLFAPQIGRKSVSAANDKHGIGNRLVAPLAEMTGKRRAVNVAAALVHRHQYRFVGDDRKDFRGFLGHPGWRLTRTALRKLMNLEAAKTKFATHILEPRTISFGQFAFRPLLQTADRNHHEAHG